MPRLGGALIAAVGVDNPRSPGCGRFRVAASRRVWVDDDACGGIVTVEFTVYFRTGEQRQTLQRTDQLLN